MTEYDSAWAESDEREIHPERGTWGEESRRASRELLARAGYVFSDESHVDLEHEHVQGESTR